MKTTQHTIDAEIPHFFGVPGCEDLERVDLRARVVYQYDKLASEQHWPVLNVVEARILQDGDAAPDDVNDWAQAWLDCDGYDRARQHAESERS